MRFLCLFITMIACAAGAQAQIYLLESGDTVQISVFQDPKLDRQVLVLPDGRISFPLAGHIKASGRSLESLEGALKGRLQKFYSETLDVTASLVGQAPPAVEEPPENKIIYITGEVRNPGQFILRDGTNVLQAIAISGGLATFAAKRRIQVRRKIDGVDVVMPFDYKDVESGRDIEGNFLLQDGDVIVVPEKGLFR